MEVPGAEAPRSSAEGASRVERRRREDRGAGDGVVPFPTKFVDFSAQKDEF